MHVRYFVPGGIAAPDYFFYTKKRNHTLINLNSALVSIYYDYPIISETDDKCWSIC